MPQFIEHYTPVDITTSGQLILGQPRPGHVRIVDNITLRNASGGALVFTINKAVPLLSIPLFTQNIIQGGIHRFDGPIIIVGQDPIIIGQGLSVTFAGPDVTITYCHIQWGEWRPER